VGLVFLFQEFFKRLGSIGVISVNPVVPIVLGLLSFRQTGIAQG